MEVDGSSSSGNSLASLDRSLNSPWLVSPLFDLLFIANLGWLLCLAPGLVDGSAITRLEFWQIYFVTTPHRWITLLLVATDPDRRGKRTWFFVFLAVCAAAIVAGVYFGTRGFYCLIIVDYLWNAWHFGAQHGGILRIYARRGGGGHPRWETLTIRTLVIYAFLRTAGWTTGWTETVTGSLEVLRACDLLIIGLPVLLLLGELANRPAERPGKVVYLLSVTGLYSCLLIGVRHNFATLVASVTVAVALFHATEYLAIVTYYAKRRQSSGSASAFQTMSQHWFTFLLSFVVILGGVAGLIAMFPQMKDFWLGINLWAAYLHYSYDGMIWKLRQPATAKALAVELNVAKG